MANLYSWHFIWSKFYFHKKHYGKIFAYIYFLPILVRILLRILFYKTIKDKRFIKYYYRWDGLVNSILEKPVRLLDVCDLKVGIATLCDGIYFMKDCVVEDDLVIFGGTQIEKGATKLCYKASKLDRYDKTTEDRIIYPYDDKTKPFDEEWFKCTYPMAYEYLSQHKDKLLSRDKNKFGKKVKEGKATW